MKRIAILDDYQGVALSLGPWDRLQGRCEIQVFRHHFESEDELVAKLSGFDVLVANRERTAFPRSVLQRLPQLRLIATSGKRNASIDIAAARDMGVVVSGTDTLGYPTAELTWALILALSRGLMAEVNSVREGGWQQTIGTGLHGKVLGVGSATRVPYLPDVQAISETLAGFEAVTWFGIVAPPKTPAAVVEKMSAAVADALKDEGVRSQVQKLSATPVGSTPGEMGTFMKSETAQWGGVIRSANVKID